MSFYNSELHRPFIVSVEGNIGTGKSTFLETCDESGIMKVVPEPVEEWRDVNGQNLLSDFYLDPKAWGTSFQMVVNLSMLKKHVKPRTKHIRVVERSLSSARHCFTELLREDNSINETNYHILQQWYDFIEPHHRTKPDMIVYIRTTPAVAYQRMRKRSRSEETVVPFEYLQRLHERHEEWLGMEMRKSSQLFKHGEGDGGTYVVVVEADRCETELKAEYQETCINIYWAAEGGTFELTSSCNKLCSCTVTINEF